jgi:hypothetical protein
MSSQLSLHDVLKSSYMDKNKQANELAKHNYKYDSMLSNHNQQIYYNPDDRKLLNVVTGSHNLADWGTDAYLAVGKLKDTNRYKEADRTLKEAKKKYGIDSATVAGHSLGASIGSYIAGSGDQFYGLDAGYTIGQKTRSRDGNHHHYRTTGDVVSALGANAKNMTTIDTHDNGIIGNLKNSVAIGGAIHPIAGIAHGIRSIVQAHDINKIRDEQIKI